MQIKVVSLNIWDGGRALDDAIAFIKQEDPDILGLQEVYDGTDSSWEQRFRTMSILREKLDYPYHDYAAEFIEDLDGRRIPQGNAVFSRFRIKDHQATFFIRPREEHFLDRPENWGSISHNLQHLVLETSVGDIDYINFHGPKDNDGDNDSEYRQKTVNALLKEIEGRSRVIITGDTNARPTNASMQRLGEKISNVFGTSIATTFNMKRKDNPGYATSVVDMIFVSEVFEVLEKYVPQVDISDHLPLVVRLQLTK